MLALIDGAVFEVVEEFGCLGTLVTCVTDVSSEVKRRIALLRIEPFTDCEPA